MSKQNLTQKQRLRKRINGYKNLGNSWVFMLEADFRGVFSPIMIKKYISDSSENFVENLDKLIDICSEDECLELNQGLDCYQIDKKNEN